MHAIKKPYLLLIGDMTNSRNAKTALGLRDWAREDCVGQLRFNDEAVDTGLPEMTPEQAAAAGAKTLVIGIAPSGGQLPTAWYPTLQRALAAGLDIASGLHQRLKAIPEIAQLAQTTGRQLHDVRHTNRTFKVGNGEPRSGMRLLTVGTDCALGKKYTALAIAKAMRDKGFNADFRATGQTGILISGSGVSVDAVVADFIAGAAESLSPANADDHWDIIEGQGSLFHPAYAGVSLGLLHGSQPDALVMCHDPWRKKMNNFPHFDCPTIEEAMRANLWAAHRTNPDAQFVGIALNTSTANDEDAGRIIKETAETTGLPCVDPLRTGVAPIIAALEELHATRV